MSKVEKKLRAELGESYRDYHLKELKRDSETLEMSMEELVDMYIRQVKKRNNQQ